MTGFKIRSILKDWVNLNNEVNDLSEDELTELFDAEIGGKCRISFIKRIVIRRNKLIGDRKLKEILKVIS